jgi:hypothetical protein
MGITTMNDKLLNIGPKSAAWLRQVGVRTQADLAREGALGTFLKVKRAGFKPSLNLLYALAGAEKGCHWTALSADEKATMVLAVNASDDAIKQAKKFVTPARDIVVERSSADDRAEAPEPSGLFDDPTGGESDASTGHDGGGHGD